VSVHGQAHACRAGASGGGCVQADRAQPGEAALHRQVTLRPLRRDRTAAG
jgi:hypothetical protein